MFTGLIQGVGTIHLHGEGVLVEPPTSFFPLELGESISVDGVCLTVSAIRNNAFLADISEETLSRTSLGAKAYEKGFVNLEPALRLSDRLGGHLVSGHVDGLGKVHSIETLNKSWNLKISWEDIAFAKYTCEKASIALNGISLTISESTQEGDIFSIAVIPHTWLNTSLRYLKIGERINLEADLMAKYAENLLRKMVNEPKKKKAQDLSLDWLAHNGFS